jgi:hypothetical protein
MPIVECSVCGRLVRALPRGTHALGDGPLAKEYQLRNPRAQRWYPVEHPAADDDSGGRTCSGEKEAH